MSLLSCPQVPPGDFCIPFAALAHQGPVGASAGAEARAEARHRESMAMQQALLAASAAESQTRRAEHAQIIETMTQNALAVGSVPGTLASANSSLSTQLLANSTSSQYPSLTTNTYHNPATVGEHMTELNTALVASLQAAAERGPEHTASLLEVLVSVCKASLAASQALTPAAEAAPAAPGDVETLGNSLTSRMSSCQEGLMLDTLALDVRICDVHIGQQQRGQLQQQNPMTDSHRQSRPSTQRVSKKRSLQCR